MRYIFIFLCLNKIYGSRLLVKGQCTVSTGTEISAGAHDCAIEVQEEYYQNVQTILRELSFNVERIGERFEEDANEAGKILSKEHYHDLLNAYQNLSVKIDSLGVTASGAAKCLVDKDLNRMYQNLSLRLEIFDEKFQGTDKSLLLLSNAEQYINESLKGYDENLQAMHRNTTNGINGIHKSLHDAEQRLIGTLEERDQNMQRNLSSGLDGVHEKLNDVWQRGEENMKVRDQRLQLMHENITSEIYAVHKKLSDTEQNYRESLDLHDKNMYRNLSNGLDIINKTLSEGEQRDKENMASLDQNMQTMYRNITAKIDGMYQNVNDAELSITTSVERLDQKLQTFHRNVSDAIASIQSRVVNSEQNIKDRIIQSHDLSLESLRQNISTEVDRIDGRLHSLFQQVGEIYQLAKKMVCPNGFDYLPEINRCFYLNLELKTWDNARNSCARYKTGAQLVSIKDSAKQEAVRRYLQHQFTKQESAVCIWSPWTDGGKLAWMVGQTRNPTQCGAPYFWKPVGAAETPFNYTNWFPGLPNCGGGDQHCAFIASAPQFDYRWEDNPCGALLCSLCEF